MYYPGKKLNFLVLDNVVSPCWDHPAHEGDAMPKHKSVEQLEAELAAIAAKTKAIELRKAIKKEKEAYSKLIQSERAAKKAQKEAKASKKAKPAKKAASKKAKSAKKAAQEPTSS